MWNHHVTKNKLYFLKLFFFWSSFIVPSFFWPITKIKQKAVNLSFLLRSKIYMSMMRHIEVFMGEVHLCDEHIDPFNGSTWKLQ